GPERLTERPPQRPTDRPTDRPGRVRPGLCVEVTGFTTLSRTEPMAETGGRAAAFQQEGDRVPDRTPDAMPDAMTEATTDDAELYPQARRCGSQVPGVPPARIGSMNSAASACAPSRSASTATSDASRR